MRNIPPVPKRPGKKKRKDYTRGRIPAPDKSPDIVPSRKQHLPLPGIKTVRMELTPEDRTSRYFLQLELMNKGMELIRKHQLRSFTELISLIEHEEAINQLYNKKNSTDDFVSDDIKIVSKSSLNITEALRIAECCATCKFYIPDGFCWYGKSKPKLSKKDLNGKSKKRFISENFPETHPWAICDLHLPDGDKKRMTKLFKKFDLEKK